MLALLIAKKNSHRWAWRGYSVVVQVNREVASDLQRLVQRTQSVYWVTASGDVIPGSFPFPLTVSSPDVENHVNSGAILNVCICNSVKPSLLYFLYWIVHCTRCYWYFESSWGNLIWAAGTVFHVKCFQTCISGLEAQTPLNVTVTLHKLSSLQLTRQHHCAIAARMLRTIHLHIYSLCSCKLCFLFNSRRTGKEKKTSVIYTVQTVQTVQTKQS